MKILFLILDGFPTFRPDVASLWGKYLARVGVTCDVSTTQLQANMSDTTWESGQRFLYQPPRNKVLEQIGSFLHDCKVLWRVKPGEYDAIQVRDKSFICIPALWFARRLGIPFFYWMSFPMTESLTRLAGTLSWRKNFLRWSFLSLRGRLGGYVLQKLVLPRCDHVFVQSDRMLEDVAAHGIHRNKMTAVPMCIDPDRFPTPLPPATLQPSETPRRRVVGYLGECSRVRRIDFLFEAIAIVKQTVPDIEFLVVGDAYEEADKRWLQETIARFNLQSNVTITGWLPANRALQTFARAEVALALMAPDPLLDSTTPTKLVEYLAMQRPVVANQHPDQSFVLDASGGGVCTTFETHAFANAICTILNDLPLSLAKAKMGRDWVMHFRSYDQASVKLKGIYEKLTLSRSK